MSGSRLESARVLLRKVTHSLGGGRWGSYTLPPTARTERRRRQTSSQTRDGVTEGSTRNQEQNDPSPTPSDRLVEREGHSSEQSDRCSEQEAHLLDHEDHPSIGSEHNSDERPTVCIDSEQDSSAPVRATLSPRLDIRESARANGVSSPPCETSGETSGSASGSAKRGSVHNKKKASVPPTPSGSGPGRCKSDAASSHEPRGRSKSFSDGSFLDRLPAAVVGEVTSPVITEGPHKPSPAAADLHRQAAVAPPRRRLSVPDGVLVGRPQTPPATENEMDDAAASDVDSGTADVMDDLPSRGTPEPEEEEEEEREEDGEIRQEDHHRVVISITSSEPEIHGPLGCQEVPPVVVRLQLGDQGRYGFNVKGGAGSSIPVTVSKVAPRSATRCSGPRLSEGDQVVLINGVDVSNFTHREVVRFIKSCRDRQVELELTVKPNVNYDGHIDLEEPLVRYVPDTTPLTLSANDNTATTLTLTPDATPLARSIAELAHALSRGIAQLEFDNLARRELSLTMDDCRLPENIAKNRYRDISPYDCSRVVLRTAESGDYINANFVNMEIPGSGIVNRYIAAQGPLHHTTDDFWAMVWEQKCPLVVMLTTLVEQGRVKCHQYWPDEGQTLLFGDFQVTTVSEEVTESFAFREITVQSQETGEERHLSHMQYVSWPDHGVPEQAADFVQFVQRVRAARAHHTAEEATVVHCSAGIGRTGVLILMETAMCLIEADQPVYPLELVRCMRRQRAMMIQTPSQFEFVCEAVVQAHHDGTVRPLSELDRPE